MNPWMFPMSPLHIFTDVFFLKNQTNDSDDGFLCTHSDDAHQKA